VRIANEPLHGILRRRRQKPIVARHDAVAKALTTRLRSLRGVTVVEEPPAPPESLPGARGWTDTRVFYLGFFLAHLVFLVLPLINLLLINKY
jgi:hypothetical protein